MLSVNVEVKEDLMESLSNILDNPFVELRTFEIYGNPYYGHHQAGNSARICDVIVENSPSVMYREFHKISFLLTIRKAIVPILSEELILPFHTKSTPIEILFLTKI